MKRVALALGTRPEATKMAPVYRALSESKEVEPIVIATGQHREQLLQALEVFNVPIAFNMDVMTERQSLPDLVARILPQAVQLLEKLRLDYLLVHGDTLTTFVMAWAGYLTGTLVGHVEAGLRSFRLYEPFPEEANRRLTAVLTDLDFAPTALAKNNLLAEGKPASRIIVTGQSGVDAIRHAAHFGQVPGEFPQGRYVMITLHRRENWSSLTDIARALRRVAREHDQYLFVYPVHLNPTVREAVWGVLSVIPNVILTDPLEYGAMAALLRRSELIITDSGGLQEEGAALGIPVAVIRNVTERPEGLASGHLSLVGTDPEQIYSGITALLEDDEKRRYLKQARNPYGDGRASVRVAQSVIWRLGCGERPSDWVG
jgi:UDP-N-acetylglucosamine 2-epimerase (non-hydrolysing)